MMNALKGEVRKLLSVKSTYIIVIASLMIVMLFAGYIEGFRALPTALQDKTLFTTESKSAVVFVGLILAISGLLLFGHEYRYNTIMYTLTSSNRRLKVFFAKVLTVSIFSILLGLFITFFSPLCTMLCLRLHGLHIVHQVYDYAIIWRCVFAVWAYAMYAFILVALIRSQIGAIVTYLLIPLIGENILIALLKENGKYLPFTSLQTVVNPGLLRGTSAVESAYICSFYVITGLIVGAFLFLRRDAN